MTTQAPSSEPTFYTQPFQNLGSKISREWFWLLRLFLGLQGIHLMGETFQLHTVAPFSPILLIGLAAVCLYLAYRDTIPMLETYDYQVALSQDALHLRKSGTTDSIVVPLNAEAAKYSLVRNGIYLELDELSLVLPSDHQTIAELMKRNPNLPWTRLTRKNKSWIIVVVTVLVWFGFFAAAGVSPL